jgi:hypothetical protein
MKPLPVIDPDNDNGKPEDHLAVATAALHAAVKGLDAPAEVLARRVGIEVKTDADATKP